MDDLDRRRILSTAFEPCEGGYLYYRNRWSPGVRVSAGEREQFISSNAAEAFLLGRQFAQRPPVTPPRHTSAWLIVDALPMTLAGGFAIAALAAAAEAGRPNSVLPASVFWGIAVCMSAAALTLVGRRVLQRSR